MRNRTANQIQADRKFDKSLKQTVQNSRKIISFSLRDSDVIVGGEKSLVQKVMETNGVKEIIQILKEAGEDRTETPMEFEQTKPSYCLPKMRFQIDGPKFNQTSGQEQLGGPKICLIYLI